MRASESASSPSTAPPSRKASVTKISRARAKRLARERHEKLQKQRARIEHILAKNHFFSIYINQCRATIGETYQMARKAEVLVSFRHGEPWIVLADDLEDFLKNHTRLAAVTGEELFTEIKNELGRKWLKKRAPIRHRSWKDREGSR